ncbi:hypothetical protein NMG60_11001199 [Bertholletia excelsa]
MQNREHHGIEIEEVNHKDTDAFVVRLQDRLEAIKKVRTFRSTAEYCRKAYICKLPQSLVEISKRAAEPEMVSIGPYHRGKDTLLEFETHKWKLLISLLSRRKESRGVTDLGRLVATIKPLETKARSCYLEPIPMSSEDFVEMMVLDGCFIIDLLYQASRSEDTDIQITLDEGVDSHNLIIRMPWAIPVLIRDLLKLENQLPFFVLQKLFDLTKEETEGEHLNLLALHFFSLALPRSSESIQRAASLEPEHLLDLFHLSYRPTRWVSHAFRLGPSIRNFHEQSMACVTQLHSAGIKFRPPRGNIDRFFCIDFHGDMHAQLQKRTDSFLEINFKEGVLEIPQISVNDVTSTLFINCIALEQCCKRNFAFFSAYIAFMSCLISSAMDVALLCEEGIITHFSHSDLLVAQLFKSLGENVMLNVRESFLADEYRKLEAYRSSHWATLRRKYFSSPWSFISLISATVLLLFTAVQMVMAILSYLKQSSNVGK